MFLILDFILPLKFRTFSDLQETDVMLRPDRRAGVPQSAASSTV